MRHVHAFKAALGGEIVFSDHPDYERARRGWNGMIDKRPALVVRCRGVSDVKTAIGLHASTIFWSLCAAAGTACQVSPPATAAWLSILPR